MPRGLMWSGTTIPRLSTGGATEKRGRAEGDMELAGYQSLNHRAVAAPGLQSSTPAWRPIANSNLRADDTKARATLCQTGNRSTTSKPERPKVLV